jgi:predicted HAD superfamily phosphohydrolase YqeG
MKTAYQPITDERDIPAWISRLGARTVVFDVEPLVAHWDSAQAALDEGVAAVIAAVAAIGGVRALCFATNSARSPSVLPSAPNGLHVSYLVSARKPLRTAPYAGLPAPGVVVGDQIATDGILARRIGYSFLHFRPQRQVMPAGPHLLSGCGEALRPLLFGRHAAARASAARQRTRHGSR